MSAANRIDREKIASDVVRCAKTAYYWGKSLNLKLLVPLLITAGVTILGWFAIHQLTAWRDQANKRREQRIAFLIEAFRRLAKASHHPRLHEVAEEVQSAVADIQLFGSAAQVHRIQSFVKELAESQEARIDALLESLRHDLREELRLPKLEGRLWWIRIQQKEPGQHSKAEPKSPQ